MLLFFRVSSNNCESNRYKTYLAVSLDIMTVANNRKWIVKNVEKKRINKIATLKKYAKLCKAEGIQSDRINVHGSENDREFKAKKLVKTKLVGQLSRQHVIAEAASNRKASEKAEKQREFERKQEEKKQRLQVRKEKKKIMTAKTRKGQPIFAGRIKNILDKLTNDS